ncbi:DUF7931 domain-containing protein [Methyloversatilis thermotolerans]|uniref:DUF7931 domain-containing protein n=1 Tax=Methyloversatilis thermotolerans TaxID=1346290 RepID=UPI000373B1AF|nr:hypothetical protein [Methyloversatilis thermotolerans]
MTGGELIFTDRAGYQAAVADCVGTLHGSLDIFDFDLTATGLDTRTMVERLHAALIAAPGSEVRVVLHDAKPLQTRMPRLWSACATHAHRIRIRETPRSLKHLTDCFILNGREALVRRIHRDHWRGRYMRQDVAEASAYANRFGEIWAACSCCISTTRLGL